MPPRCRFTKEEVASAALDIARKNGMDAVTARAVGEKLSSSSKVIFSLFNNMEELHETVMLSAYEEYQSFLTEDMSSGKYPPYKASGMAYIRFAREERELFKLLFMRDRSDEKEQDSPSDVEPLIEIIMRNIGISRDDAYMFHFEMWVYVHGIATMIATNYRSLDGELVGRMLTDAYEGLKKKYTGSEKM